MKCIVLLVLSLMLSICLLAQRTSSKTAPPKKTVAKKVAKKSGKPKKSVTSKKKKTTGVSEFEEVICFEEGPCTFNILRGDTLVFEVNTAGKQYNLLVIPNKFDANSLADFNWKTTAPENKSGHVVINSKALASSKRYISDLPAGELKLTDASSLWLSNTNFKEISKGETALTLENGQPESFKSPEEDAVAIDVNYKGKPMSLEGFAVQSKAEGEPGRKEIWILNISTNLLLIKIDNVTWSMQLKEVREKKNKK